MPTCAECGSPLEADEIKYYGHTCNDCEGRLMNEAYPDETPSTALPAGSTAFPKRFFDFLISMRMEPWEYDNGDPMGEDIDNAIMWIERHGGPA